MAEGFIQVAPDSSGKMLRARSRTVGTNTVYEQAVTLQNERYVTGAALAASFRIPARAATTQVLLSGFVASGATNLIAIRRLAVEVDTIVAKTTASPWLRLRRITAQTGGAALTPVLLDTGEALAATGFALLQDASADNTVAATQLGSTQTGVDLWQQAVPRMATQAGIVNPDALPMLPDDGGFLNDNPFVLRAGQGFQVRVDTATAPTAGDWVYGVKIAFEEFTYL